MIQIRVEGTRRFSRLLAEIQTGIRRGASGLSRKAISDLKVRVAAWNKINFDRKKRSEEWDRIDYRTLVFSRKANYIGFPNPSMEQLKLTARRISAMLDHGGLYRSVTDPKDRNFRCEIRGTNLVFGTKIPYSDKHINGKSETFSFGAVEKRRLRERVPPPRERPEDVSYHAIYKSAGTQEERLKRIRKKIGSKEYRFRQQNTRAYYVLYNWAKNNYPLKKKLPIRNWYDPMTDEVKYSIVQIIWQDMIWRRIRRMRAQYTAGYEP